MATETTGGRNDSLIDCELPWVPENTSDPDIPGDAGGDTNTSPPSDLDTLQKGNNTKNIAGNGTTFKYVCGITETLKITVSNATTAMWCRLIVEDSETCEATILKESVGTSARKSFSLINDVISGTTYYVQMGAVNNTALTGMVISLATYTAEQSGEEDFSNLVELHDGLNTNLLQDSDLSNAKTCKSYTATGSGHLVIEDVGTNYLQVFILDDNFEQIAEAPVTDGKFKIEDDVITGQKFYLKFYKTSNSPDDLIFTFNVNVSIISNNSSSGCESSSGSNGEECSGSGTITTITGSGYEININPKKLFKGGEIFVLADMAEAYGGYIKKGLMLQLDCSHNLVAGGTWASMVGTSSATINGEYTDGGIDGITLSSITLPDVDAAYWEVCALVNGEVVTTSYTTEPTISGTIFEVRGYGSELTTEQKAHNTAADKNNFDKVPSNAFKFRNGKAFKFSNGEYFIFGNND